MGKWTRAPDFHRVDRICRPMVRGLHLARDWKFGVTNGTCTRTMAFTKPDAALTPWSLFCVMNERGLAEVGGHAPHSTDDVERSAFEAVPARSSGSTPKGMSMKKAEASGHAPQPASSQIRPVSNRRRHACPLWLPGERWCAMSVLPRRPRFGRPPCCCCTNDAFEICRV